MERIVMDPGALGRTASVLREELAPAEAETDTLLEALRTLQGMWQGEGKEESDFALTEVMDRLRGEIQVLVRYWELLDLAREDYDRWEETVRGMVRDNCQ